MVEKLGALTIALLLAYSYYHHRGRSLVGVTHGAAVLSTASDAWPLCHWGVICHGFADGLPDLRCDWHTQLGRSYNSFFGVLTDGDWGCAHLSAGCCGGRSHSAPHGFRSGHRRHADTGPGARGGHDGGPGLCWVPFGTRQRRRDIVLLSHNRGSGQCGRICTRRRSALPSPSLCDRPGMHRHSWPL